MPKSLSSFTFALLAGGSLCTTGCLFQKPARAYIPPPLPPHTAKPVPPPPFLSTESGEELAMVELPNLDIGPPEFPEAPKPPVRPKPTPLPPKAAVATPAPVPVETPPPRITLMLTPDQSRALNKEIDDDLQRVARAMDVLGRKNLGPAERDKLEQITTFQKQAVQAREQDLANAVNLARRADLLAKDLLERLP